MARRGNGSRRGKRPAPEMDASKIESVVDEVTGKVVVRYAEKSKGEGVTGLAVGPNKYARRPDGTFLVYKRDVEELARQGLVRA